MRPDCRSVPLRRSRQGAALLEVSAARAADDELRRASALLDAVTLWSDEDLARHLGDHPEGPGGRWTLRVLRTAPTIYTVALFTSAEGKDPREPRRLVLSTVLYRRTAR